MKIKALLLSLAIAISLSACEKAPEPLNAGTVTDKDFVAAHEESGVQAVPVMTMDGKVSLGLALTNDYVPDKWTLTIKEGDRERKFKVSESEYNSVEIGDHFVMEDGADE